MEGGGGTHRWPPGPFSSLGRCSPSPEERAHGAAAQGRCSRSRKRASCRHSVAISAVGGARRGCRPGARRAPEDEEERVPNRGQHGPHWHDALAAEPAACRRESEKETTCAQLWGATPEQKHEANQSARGASRGRGAGGCGRERRRGRAVGVEGEEADADGPPVRALEEALHLPNPEPGLPGGAGNLRVPPERPLLRAERPHGADVGEGGAARLGEARLRGHVLAEGGDAAAGEDCRRGGDGDDEDGEDGRELAAEGGEDADGREHLGRRAEACAAGVEGGWCAWISVARCLAAVRREGGSSRVLRVSARAEGVTGGRSVCGARLGRGRCCPRGRCGWPRAPPPRAPRARSP